MGQDPMAVSLAPRLVLRDDVDNGDDRFPTNARSMYFLPDFCTTFDILPTSSIHPICFHFSRLMYLAHCCSPITISFMPLFSKRHYRCYVWTTNFSLSELCSVDSAEA